MMPFYKFQRGWSRRPAASVFPENSSLRCGPHRNETEVDREFVEGGILMLTVYKKDRVLSPKEYKLEGNKIICPGSFRIRPLPGKKKSGWMRMYRTLCLKVNGGSIEDFLYNKNVPVKVTEKYSFRMRVHFLVRLCGGATLYINRYTYEMDYVRFRRKLFFEINGRNILRVRPRDLEKILYEYEGKKREDGSLPEEESFILGPVGGVS